ncbi:hypothetical protein JVU11DRAFT_7143 [Chiua virens]|nr:hypothetical protein JVU11DRAFT_7143 [Chiua virens]
MSRSNREASTRKTENVPVPPRVGGRYSLLILSERRALTRTDFESAKRNMPATYFNAPGPIYQMELVQTNCSLSTLTSPRRPMTRITRTPTQVQGRRPCGSIGRYFVLLSHRYKVRSRTSLEGSALRETFCSGSGSGLSVEHDLTAVIPTCPHASGTANVTHAVSPNADSDTADTTIQGILDALVARFAATYIDVLFLPPTSDITHGGENPRAHFFVTLRRNIYHAFTRHLDAPEGYPSFYRCTDTGVRSVWEYRLLFVHLVVRMRILRGLVMTVTLKRRVQDGEMGQRNRDVDSVGKWRDMACRSTRGVCFRGRREPCRL